MAGRGGGGFLVGLPVEVVMLSCSGGTSAAVGRTVCATPRLSRDIATFIRRLTVSFKFSPSAPWCGSTLSYRNVSELRSKHVRTRTWWYAAVGDEAEMLMHIRHSTPMLDLVAHRIDEHVPYKYFFDQVKSFVS